MSENIAIGIQDFSTLIENHYFYVDKTDFIKEWWDKPRDKDNHYEIFPIPQKVLEQNKYLKQNPGYPDITR